MAEDEKTLLEWISIYVDESDMDMDTSNNSSTSYGFQAEETHDVDAGSIGEVKRYGIWSEVDGTVV